MPTTHTSFIRSLIVLLTVLIALPSIAALTPAASAQIASPVATNAEWVAADDGWVFDHATLPNTIFAYTEHDIADLPVPDNLFLMEVATMFPFIDAMGVDGLPQLGAADPSADPLWYLRSMEKDGISYVVLFAVSVTAVPGKGVSEILLTRPENLVSSLTAAQQGITTYGQPSLLARIDTNAVLTAGGQGQAQVPANPVGQQVPAVPAVQLTGSVTVGADTISYGGDWVYAAENSTAEIGFFPHTMSEIGLYGFFALSGVPAIDAQTSLQQFTDGFFSTFGATNVQQVMIETLPSGKAWSLHTMDVSGQRVVLVLAVDVLSVPGQFRAETLLLPLDQMQPIFASAQQSIQVNGVGAFSEIDATYATSLANGGAPVAMVNFAPLLQHNIIVA